MREGTDPTCAIVAEHTEYHVEGSAHDAFLDACAMAQAILLDVRGCRSVAVARVLGHLSAYRMRIEWRSPADIEAFEASEASVAVANALRGFDAQQRWRETANLLLEGHAEHDPLALRRAFGQFATGIAVVTAHGPDGPVGMVVTSFNTVSLRPALVAFCAAHTTTTWPALFDARRCCINILAASQEELCKQLASRRERRFDGIEWSPAPSGAPILAGVVSWLDCRIEDVRSVGDHDLVVLEVLAHDATSGRAPLLFHRSAYQLLESG